ncbi:MAG: hypothetical protein GY925_12020, partial [Actinomycetia bacterium]|nr:hypothetical protein [Actinomycetes bacterium]
RRRLYIIDEGNSFIGAQNTGEDKELLVLSSWIVTRLAAMAAFVGVHLIYITQSPNVESYGLSGGPTRLNIGGRMIVGSSSQTWIRELFQSEISPAVQYALAKGIKGRTIFEGLGDSNEGVSKGQIYYATQTDVTPLVPSEPPTEVIDYDLIGPERFDEVLQANAETEAERRAVFDQLRKTAQHRIKHRNNDHGEAA